MEMVSRKEFEHRFVVKVLVQESELIRLETGKNDGNAAPQQVVNAALKIHSDKVDSPICETLDSPSSNRLHTA